MAVRDWSISDAVSIEVLRKRLEQAKERERKALELARSAASNARNKGMRTQSSAEQKARSRAFAAGIEVSDAERALREAEWGGIATDRARLHRALDRVLKNV